MITADMAIAGWTAASLVFFTHWMKSMTRLRAVAIASNIAVIVYGLIASRDGMWQLVAPLFFLHLLLLPLNVHRFMQCRQIPDSENSADPHQAAKMADDQAGEHYPAFEWERLKQQSIRATQDLTGRSRQE